MALQTTVKVSNITNLSDARYCAGMGVTMAGFDLETESENYVDADQFRAITGWIAGVQLVGELRRAEAVEAEELLQAYPLHFLQVVQSMNWEALRKVGVPLICKVPWDERMATELFHRSYRTVRPWVDWFLIESETDALTESDMKVIRQLAPEYPVLLGFGITPQNVHTVLEYTGVGGIALKGGQEIRPGFKDFDELSNILEAIEVEE